MLTKPMRKYVQSETKTGYDKHMQYVNNGRLKMQSIQAIKDLALIAEKLPEEQQTEIFNEKTMRPLFVALFNLPTLKETDGEDKHIELEKRRQRIIGLWKAFFSGGIISNPFYGAQLVNKEVWRALSLNMDRNLQAILYAISYQEPNEKQSIKRSKS